MDTIIWARQVKRETISRLYARHAAGIFDETLADEVAYAMLARADSIVKVTRAHSEGVLECPACARTVRFDPMRRDYVASCECGWRIARADLQRTYKRKQLVGGAAMPVIGEAIKSFPAKGTYADKIIWIDNLIHAFHGELNELREQTGLAFRPIARNFIEGSLFQVVELIESLAYGDSPDFKKSRDEWIRKLKISYVPEDIRNHVLSKH